MQRPSLGGIGSIMNMGRASQVCQHDKPWRIAEGHKIICGVCHPPAVQEFEWLDPDAVLHVWERTPVELRHRAKKDTRGSFHEAQCRKCGKGYTTRGLSHICSTCWRKDHAPKKKAKRTTVSWLIAPSRRAARP
jgi:hypothetical protein